MAFIFFDQSVKDVRNGVWIAHHSRTAMSMDDRIVPCRHRRFALIPVGRDVSVRTMEDRNRRRTPVEVPPVLIRPGDMTCKNRPVSGPIEQKRNVSHTNSAGG